MRPMLECSAYQGHVPHIQSQAPSRTLPHLLQLKLCKVQILEKDWLKLRYIDPWSSLMRAIFPLILMIST